MCSKVKSSKSANNTTRSQPENTKKSAHHKSGDKEGLLIDFGGKEEKQAGNGDAWEANWEDDAWESLNKDD